MKDKVWSRLADLEGRQIAATVHAAVVRPRADVVLALVLEVLFQVAGSAKFAIKDKVSAAPIPIHTVLRQRRRATRHFSVCMHACVYSYIRPRTTSTFLIYIGVCVNRHRHILSLCMLRYMHTHTRLCLMT
jgi:hypothetical protein